MRPVKTGALCLLFALCLGLAAGSLGLGPGDTPRDGFLDPTYLREHGGLFGESLYSVVSTLFSDVGAHLLFAFLLLAGVLLLTGASVAGVLTSTHRAATTTGERVRRSTQGLTTAFGGDPTAPLPPTRRSPAQELGDEPEPVQPPEPEDSEPVVRATHVEAPALDASERYPDLFEDEPSEDDHEDFADDAWEDEEADEEPLQPELPDAARGRRRRGRRAGRAHAARQQALAGHRGRRRRLQAAQADLPDALQRRAEAATPRASSARASSWSRRSATSTSRRASSAPSAGRT